MIYFMNCKIIFIFLVTYCFHVVSLLEYSPILTIPDGSVRGLEETTTGENITYYAYRGIPYAEPPIQDLRFAAPVKNSPWTGILDAIAEPTECTQMSGWEVIGSEDCLYINVYTTSLNSSLPVMVYIYGGGFTSGSTNSSGSPDFLLEKQVIFVTFNYRLGVFGFLSTEDTVAPGNWGLKDQVLALTWVKNNIEYFGGDPNRITIFGNSAGAASVSYLVTDNKTSGLYQRAIIQSGSALCLWALSRNASEKAFGLGFYLNIITDDSSSLIDQLRQIDYKELKAAENLLTILIKLAGNILDGLPFAVVQEPEHDGAIVTGRSYEKLLRGDYNRVPTILGFNSYEMARATENSIILNLFNNFDSTPYKFAPYDLTSNITEKTLAGLQLRYHFFSIVPFYLQLNNINKFLSVDQFNRPIRETVNLMAQYNDVYFYQFSYIGDLIYPNRTFDGVSHGENVKYLFYTPYDEYASVEDLLTRQRMLTLWTNFAKTGNPVSSDPFNILQNVTWMPNNPNTNTSTLIQYLNINHNLTMETNPDQANWEYYSNQIYDVYGDPSYYNTY